MNKTYKKGLAATIVLLLLLAGAAYLHEVMTNSDVEQADHVHDADGNHVVESVSSSGDIHSHFSYFDNVSTSEEGGYLRVSSDGIADHQMMVGITNWQQQVALPQDYTGNNSWSIPLHPEIAEEPLLLADHFHRGAVAIAVNGVPIFNAVNNRGEYAVEIGELDEWGGHSGKADDYHYHMVPEFLETTVGVGNPVAYAFDGFPVLAETTKTLDEYLGLFNDDGSYEYHAVDYAPYFIAGFRGEVEVDSFANAPEDQVEPQASTKPVRTANYGPLNGASITDFSAIGTNGYLLQYSLGGLLQSILYKWDDTGMYTFTYTDAEGNEKVETFKK